jgi:predicted RNA-binding Zn-ribbon protein involved in translation (DUF1610 family)
MTKRKHKYKQRLSELETWAKTELAALLAQKRNGKRSGKSFLMGRIAQAEMLVNKLGRDEADMQAMDDKIRAAKKVSVMAMMWCMDCLEEGAWDMNSPCPKCGSQEIRRGHPPRPSQSR